MQLWAVRNLGEGGISEWAFLGCNMHPTRWYFCPKTKKELTADTGCLLPSPCNLLASTAFLLCWPMGESLIFKHKAQDTELYISKILCKTCAESTWPPFPQLPQSEIIDQNKVLFALEVSPTNSSLPLHLCDFFTIPWLRHLKNTRISISGNYVPQKSSPYNRISIPGGVIQIFKKDNWEPRT